MSWLYIIYTSTVSYAVLFGLCKLIGNKQMSELSMFDYINGITIGSIAAEAATALDKSFMHCILAMAVYGLLAVAISLICSKSLKLNRLISGKSIPLISMNKIYYKNLKKSRLDISELLTQLRCMGYFDINEIAYAYMESNGSISVLPKEGFRPASASDVKTKLEQTKPSITLVADGVFLEENLKMSNTTKERIMKEAHAAGASHEKDILLATYGSNDNINIYLKTGELSENDLFQ